ncbi:protein zyg-11 homolog B-like [Neocloeon triangulifer]|uniref:protein zyg-11 homolog B-like n=1 Tax=Neocloeon triangulifer TaxID=2078957 RepID=UPI00286F1E4A|nr:protein zyg-11 homolog B-like [Neocloeon triangulifer]
MSKFKSPSTLQDACIGFICANLEELCFLVPPASELCDNSTHHGASPYPGPNKCCGCSKESAHRLRFRSGLRLHSDLASRLLFELCESRKLCDTALTLFDTNVTLLKKIQLRNIKNTYVTAKGLRMLKSHKLTDLEITGLTQATVNDLLGCVGEWTLQNLRSLNVSRGTFLDHSKFCVVVSLAKLKGLRSLDVSYTEFNKHGLEVVTNDLPNIEALDISATRVDDITPLRRLKDRLRSLSMYNLRISSCENTVAVLLELNKLCKLDISDEKDNHPFEMFSPTKINASDLLKHPPGIWPDMIYLDISGKDDINQDDLLNFVLMHPKIQFLGLLRTGAGYSDIFLDSRCPNYRPDIIVTGTADVKQILEALNRYAYRPNFVQKCLYKLFRITTNSKDPQIEFLKVVLRAMKTHGDQFGVQMASTACLYNLTKGEIAKEIHPQILEVVVNQTLGAMETFPNHYQLQKNTLLTLCSDRILQDVKFDKFRCARLVMECLCAFDDASMNRMSVAICSILAAKISTNETSELGSKPTFMKKLLSLVRSKVETKQVDITMKFTLSALWNLTDESPKTCDVFLREGGLTLFLEVLSIFRGESAVETKVLGLINNIAEVPILRRMLMVEIFLNHLRDLLHSEHLDVSYFAAGIVAHLASDGAETWTVPIISRADMLDELGNVVLKWETPEGEMVAYRSFQPFFSLLKCETPYQVQLWAVWAIQHVCTKNSKRYCPMLVEEGGDSRMKILVDNENTNPAVKTICSSIMDVLSSETVYYAMDVEKIIEDNQVENVDMCE